MGVVRGVREECIPFECRFTIARLAGDDFQQFFFPVGSAFGDVKRLFRACAVVVIAARYVAVTRGHIRIAGEGHGFGDAIDIIIYQQAHGGFGEREACSGDLKVPVAIGGRIRHSIA